MNILDENILQDQRELLLNWQIPFRQIGYEVGRKGMKDDEIIPFLLTFPSPWVSYSDGVAGEVDLSHLAGKGVFSLWNDFGAFEQVYIGGSGAIAWTDEIEICPDATYMKITGMTLSNYF